MSTTLTEIIETELAIYKQIEECGGEITPETDLLLSQIKLDQAQKVDACRYIMAQADLRIQFCKEREREFQIMRKAAERVKERLNYNIKIGMDALNLREIKGNDYRFVLSTRKEPKLVIDPDQVEEHYLQRVVEFVPDKEKIREDLNMGLEVPGCHYEPIVSLSPYPNNDVSDRPSQKQITKQGK